MRPIFYPKLIITANDVGKEYQVMGNVTTKRALRKATFNVDGVEYTPVNKRAKAKATLIVGEGKVYTKRDLKKIAKKGKVLVYVYTKAGLRKVA